MHQYDKSPCFSFVQIDFIILCGNLVRFSDHLVQHVEPLILNLEPPWDTPEPCSKRAREDEEREVQIFSALVWLLRKVARLNAAWDWSGVFSYLTNQNKGICHFISFLHCHFIYISRLTHKGWDSRDDCIEFIQTFYTQFYSLQLEKNFRCQIIEQTIFRTKITKFNFWIIIV